MNLSIIYWQKFDLCSVPLWTFRLFPVLNGFPHSSQLTICFNVVFYVLSDNVLLSTQQTLSPSSWRISVDLASVLMDSPGLSFSDTFIPVAWQESPQAFLSMLLRSPAMGSTIRGEVTWPSSPLCQLPTTTPQLPIPGSYYFDYNFQAHFPWTFSHSSDTFFD